jgi:hypothetical protein
MYERTMHKGVAAVTVKSKFVKVGKLQSPLPTQLFGNSMPG